MKKETEKTDREIKDFILPRNETVLADAEEALKVWKKQPLKVRVKYAQLVAKATHDATDHFASRRAYSHVVNATAVPSDYGVSYTNDRGLII